MSNFSKNLMLWAVISLVMVVLFNLFNQPQGGQFKMSYSLFLNRVEQGQIASVKIQGKKLTGLTYKVQVTAEPEEEAPWYISVFVSWFPMLLLIGVWIFFMRQMQGGGGKAMSFGRSRARMLSEEATKVTFADVAGVDEAKEELQEVVDFLSNPQKFTRLGGRIPKGVLLIGSPGTGKTLLARAVAGEAGVPFFSISGSDFVEMFVGVGAARVRDLFIQGKRNAPCLIFIDEIDAVGRQRGAGLGGGHDEREQTLNASTLPFCVRVGSTDRLLFPTPTLAVANGFWRCILAKRRFQKMLIWIFWLAELRVFRERIWKTWSTKRLCTQPATNRKALQWQILKKPKTRF